ncbi:Asp23/Gls24 family envelope stress response protein [Spongiactinospora gelatinilytica]|uniref:Asp23/Gls24 family envelope stress response protein n=1 Tax=Spongiactinospora gelatinilytica TaxID=2666298 RepID=A0A2W2GPI1_9ACTN|nr:Asp23/Gls24 family envelope stress response protein [Spongiactinospora gelatinilytica]PZG49772.1 Asp23/Gls24 family envelope stress response protein [Spongiactinospora gelatinilytica]
MSETTHREAAVPRARTEESGAAGPLQSGKGKTTIADGVVAKIAAMAARDVSGVHEMGGAAGRALNAVRGMVGGGDRPTAHGVSVEVGERQAAVDVNLVADYGVAIPDMASAVRRNVITAVERMCGLEVTEVNVKVDDVYLPGDDKQSGEQKKSQQQEESRVQ